MIDRRPVDIDALTNPCSGCAQRPAMIALGVTLCVVCAGLLPPPDLALLQHHAAVTLGMRNP